VLCLDTQIPAELQAGVGARNVVEAVAIQAADLYELHRLCLYRHIRSLRPSHRNEPRGGTEEKTFHHLHLNLHLLTWEGSVSVGRCSPWKVPLRSPLRPTRPVPPLSPLGTGLTGRSDLGMPPSVARSP